MNSKEIANIIYNCILDMDYNDYIEYADTEIGELAKEIDECGEVLRYALECIAYANEKLYDWHETMKGETI